MAVELLDYVPSLKREVIPAGTTAFASLENADWVGYLADAFWEARLDGFLEGFAADGTPGKADYEIGPIVSGGPEIDNKDMALVILYAGIKILRNRILNSAASGGFRAKAGPVEFEQDSGLATVLAEMLKQMRATKDRIIAALDENEVTGVMLIDAYSTRLFEPVSYFGGRELAGG